MSKALHDHLIALYDVAEDADSPAVWAQAARVAEAAADAHLEDSELCYLAGLYAYNSGDSTATHRYLTRTLEIDPSHSFARLYLGHQLFDEGRYEEAKDAFARVDGTSFASIGQQWRALKLRELFLCCRLYVAETVDSEDVVHLVETYLATDEEDKAVPSEIMECVRSLDLSCDTQFREIGYAVLRLAQAEQHWQRAASIARQLAI